MELWHKDGLELKTTEKKQTHSERNPPPFLTLYQEGQDKAQPRDQAQLLAQMLRTV